MKKFLLTLSVLVFGLFSTASGYYITASNDSCGVITHPGENKWGGGGTESVRYVDFAFQCGTNPPCTGHCHVFTTYSLYKNYMHRGSQELISETYNNPYTGDCCMTDIDFAEDPFPMMDSTIKSRWGSGYYTIIFSLYQGQMGMNPRHIGDFYISFAL